MGGYTNRILRVDLSNGSFAEETLSDGLIRDYVGGRGFGAKLLYDDLRKGVDPLGEENELVFVSGPLAGTNAQSFSRWKVMFKSPLTGTFGRSSGGGHFAAELKFAGFDAVVVRGVAERPAYLWIHDGKYELRDASYLWGLNCSDTHQLIREELHDMRVRLTCIGPAGENGVKYAAIFSDRAAATRGGAGAVMGAKNLKAIAVRGSGKVGAANPEAFASAVRDQIETIKASMAFGRLATLGTTGGTDNTNVLGMFPTRNFREGVLPDWQRIASGEYTKMRVRKDGCHACMIRCRNITKVGEGRYRGAWTEGPEFETIFAFAGSTGVASPGLAVAADHLCDELGMDTMSAGVTIGFAYELFERGIISAEDTGGLYLTYGDDRPVLGLLRQIAYREGFGDVLAEGSRGAAVRIGRNSEQYAMQVKGLEIAGYDPRGAKAQGLSMMTSSNGADQNAGYSGAELRGSVDRFAVEGKGAMTMANQDVAAIKDAAIFCVFGSLCAPDLSALGRLLSSATGIADFADPDYLMKVGERISNLERLFNVREGFGRGDDIFPSRFVNEAMKEGPCAGVVFEAEQLLTDYYQARGWDLETGIPTAAKLEELRLGFANDGAGRG